MSRMCEGRVAIVTGAGRGIGREYALMLAEHGAKVVVNDLGGDRDGTGADVTPAQQVVDEITAMGGQAAVNGADVSDFAAAKEMVDQAIDTFGGLDVVVNNAGILRDRMLTNMTEDEWDLVIKVHLKGTFAPAAPRRRVLAGAVEGGRGERRADHQHHVGVGHLRQRRPDQLRRRQAGHRRLHVHRRPRAAALRRHRERHRARRPHPSHRGPRPRAQRGSQGGQLTPVGRSALHVAGQSPVRRHHRAGCSSRRGGCSPIAEGWHRGPTSAAVDDPEQVDDVIRGLLAQSPPPAGMDGQDLPGWDGR